MTKYISNAAVPPEFIDRGREFWVSRLKGQFRAALAEKQVTDFVLTEPEFVPEAYDAATRTMMPAYYLISAIGESNA